MTDQDTRANDHGNLREKIVYALCAKGAALARAESGETDTAMSASLRTRIATVNECIELVERVEENVQGSAKIPHTESELAAAKETISRLQKVLDSVALGHFALLSWEAVLKARGVTVIPFSVDETNAADVVARDFLRTHYGLRVMSSSVRIIEA